MRREEFEKLLSAKKPRAKKRRRRGNGNGTIEYRKDQKNHYRVKIATETYTNAVGNLQTRYKVLGSYPTRAEAEEALAEYRKTPYDLNCGIKTFEELYKAWLSERAKELNPTSIRNWGYIYEYCHQYFKMPIRQFTVSTIKEMMDTAYVEVKGKNGEVERKIASTNTKERIKSLCNNMFDYAVENELLNYNPARKFKVTGLLKEIDTNRKIKKPFTPQQVQELWKRVNEFEQMDMLLIQIYTGLRPSELCLLKTENIFLDKNYLIGGMKTEAGTNRIIPIHPEIMELIEERYQRAVHIEHSEYLFTVWDNGSIKPIRYDDYYDYFHEIMNEMGYKGFSPHCARHTFSSQAEMCGIRELAQKRIMGHSVKSDVTEKYYKHDTIDYLYKQICLLNFEVDNYVSDKAN